MWIRARRAALASVLAAALLTASPGSAAAAEGAGRRVDLLRQGYDLAYNLDHDEAVAVFTQAIREAPDDPAAYRGIAAITWLRILFLQGRILVDNNLSGAGRTISRRRVRTPKPPEDLSRTFESHIERAVTLSGARRCAAPRTTPMPTTSWARPSRSPHRTRRPSKATPCGRCARRSRRTRRTRPCSSSIRAARTPR